jgi:hypothetical protein
VAEDVEAAAAARVELRPRQMMQPAAPEARLLRMPTPVTRQLAAVALVALQPAAPAGMRPLLPTLRQALAVVMRPRPVEAEPLAAVDAEAAAAVQPAADVEDAEVMLPLPLLTQRPLLLKLHSLLRCSAQTPSVTCGLQKLPAIRFDSLTAIRSPMARNVSYSPPTGAWVRGTDCGNPTGMQRLTTTSSP